MFENATRYDKLEVAGKTLHDTICNFFAGNHSITIVNNARAVSEVVNGLHNHFKKKHKLIETFDRASDLRKGDENLVFMNTRISHRSNFAKHADRDPLGNKDYHEADAILAIRLASVGFSNLVGALASSDIDLIDIMGLEGGDTLFAAPTKIDALIQLFDVWLRMTDRSQESKEEYFRLIRKHKLHIHDHESDYSLTKYEDPKPSQE